MSLTKIEADCLEAFRTQARFVVPDSLPETDAWTMFGIGVALEAGKLVRSIRSKPLVEEVEFKDDGSPVSKIEPEIEAMCRQRLNSYCSEATMVGEETGGTLPAKGLAVAIDPIDGTWALLNRSSTCAVSVAVFRDAEPSCGIVLNPATGELAYACAGQRTRLVQVSALGEADTACDLPLDGGEEGTVLVNLHPSKNAADAAHRLFQAWNSGDVSMLRMAGGSPAWALLEAAKGSSIYVNLWSRKPADAFDLAAGILIVQGAGGQVTDLSAQPIRPVGHAGPFIAAIDPKARSAIAALVASSPAL
jgi:fructose-1,6-bisphosphatase/inositol monophosphatase family enzyme